MGQNPNKKAAEKWCEDIQVASIMNSFLHIYTSHTKDKDGNAPLGKSYFTEKYLTSVKRIINTVHMKQSRYLYEAKEPKRVLIVRDFGLTVIGKDKDDADCTYCVVCIGLASQGKDKGKTILYTAYPATKGFVDKLAPLGGNNNNNDDNNNNI